MLIAVVAFLAGVLGTAVAPLCWSVVYSSNIVALQVPRTGAVLHTVVCVEVVHISTAVAALGATVLRTSTGESRYCWGSAYQYGSSCCWAKTLRAAAVAAAHVCGGIAYQPSSTAYVLWYCAKQQNQQPFCEGVLRTRIAVAAGVLAFCAP